MPLFELCDILVGTSVAVLPCVVHTEVDAAVCSDIILVLDWQIGVAVLPGLVHMEVDTAVCSDRVLVLDWQIGVDVYTAVLAGCFTGVAVTGECVWSLRGSASFVLRKCALFRRYDADFVFTCLCVHKSLALRL